MYRVILVFRERGFDHSYLTDGLCLGPCLSADREEKEREEGQGAGEREGEECSQQSQGAEEETVLTQYETQTGPQVTDPHTDLLYLPLAQ